MDKFKDLKKEFKKVENFSSFVDFTIEKAMPRIYEDSIKKVFDNSKKTIDYFMRHII